jgi:hypothetical protein
VKVKGKPQRPVTDDEFSDLTTVPIVGMQWVEEGELEVEFESDLDDDVKSAVQQRMGSRNGNEETLRNQAVQAMKGNRDFVALAAPTNPQTLAQVKALSRQMNGVLRMLLGELDDTD